MLEVPGKEQVKALLENDIEKIESQKSSIPTNLFFKVYDLVLQTWLLYSVTIIVLGYFVIQSWERFDKAYAYLTIPLYMFSFNFCDTLGRYIPPSYLILHKGTLFTANYTRIGVIVYYAFILWN